MKKKLLSMLLVGAMAVMSISGCSSNGASETTTPKAGETAAATTKAASKDPITLGVLAPLTGDVSVYGIAVKNGIDLAIDEINKAGGVLDQQVALETLDEKGDIAEAVTAYNNLVGKEITALIGDVTSKPSMAVAEIAATDRMPMLTPTGTAAPITTYGDNIFRTCFIDPFQGKIMATFAAENLKAKNVAIVYNTSDDYSQGVAKAFEEKAKELGLTVVANEGYGADDKDFRTQLTKIQALNPDALFVPDYYQKVALIATQAREIGYTNPLLGADGWDGVLTVLDDSNKKAVDNSYFSNHYSTTDTEKVVADFVTNYKAKYNEVPNAFAALGYDSAYIMTQAIKAAGSTDKEAIITALKAINYTGVTGNITFDENGDPIKSVAVIKLENGEAKLDSKVSAK